MNQHLSPTGELHFMSFLNEYWRPTDVRQSRCITKYNMPGKHLLLQLITYCECSHEISTGRHNRWWITSPGWRVNFDPDSGVICFIAKHCQPRTNLKKKEWCRSDSCDWFWFWQFGFGGFSCDDGGILVADWLTPLGSKVWNFKHTILKFFTITNFYGIWLDRVFLNY